MTNTWPSRFQVLRRARHTLALWRQESVTEGGNTNGFADGNANGYVVRLANHVPVQGMLQRVPREWWGDCGERVLGLMIQELRKLDKQRSEQNKIRWIFVHRLDFKTLLTQWWYASVYVYNAFWLKSQCAWRRADMHVPYFCLVVLKRRLLKAFAQTMSGFLWWFDSADISGFLKLHLGEQTPRVFQSAQCHPLGRFWYGLFWFACDRWQEVVMLLCLVGVRGFDVGFCSHAVSRHERMSNYSYC